MKTHEENLYFVGSVGHGVDHRCPDHGARHDGLPQRALTECEVDLTGETLTIFHFGDLSGAFAFITQPIVSAVTDAVNYWNGRGGVCGAMLQQVYDDTGGNVEATQSAYDRFTSEFADELDLLLLYSSSDGELLREQLAEDEIVSFISAGSIESLYGEDGHDARLALRQQSTVYKSVRLRSASSSLPTQTPSPNR